MREYSDIEKAALRDVAEFMAAAARTAPKTRGRDNLEIIISEGDKERLSLINKMKEIDLRDNKPSFTRDAESVKESHQILIIGTKTETLGLNCGYCGFDTCEALSKTAAKCVYNSMDLGIALGSSAALAARFHVDNRLMYSIGRAAIELRFFKKEITQAIGIPLSATGKNPFFDRK